MFETNEDNTVITYIFRNKEHVISWPKHQESGKLIEQDINNILDAEMIENDMKCYKETLKFKWKNKHKYFNKKSKKIIFDLF
ncbi:MAG: hypothetical protein IKL15_02285 [Mycoplasmataceae bacterium]|nr:hypothetical protein [Mycoplasmataceae bacterium]